MGRPKGSKNKKTLERERLERERLHPPEPKPEPTLRKQRVCQRCLGELKAADGHFHSQGWYSGQQEICCKCTKEIKPHWKCPYQQERIAQDVHE